VNANGNGRNTKKRVPLRHEIQARALDRARAGMCISMGIRVAIARIEEVSGLVSVGQGDRSSGRGGLGNDRRGVLVVCVCLEDEQQQRGENGLMSGLTIINLD